MRKRPWQLQVAAVLLGALMSTGANVAAGGGRDRSVGSDRSNGSDVGRDQLSVATPPQIGIGTLRFDPIAGLPPGVAAKRPDSEPGLWLMQFHGPIAAEWRLDLAEAGIEVLDYVPHYAYLVWLAEAQASDWRRQSQVRAMVPYAPAFKLGGGVLELDPGRTHRLYVGTRVAGLEQVRHRVWELGGSVLSGEVLLAQGVLLVDLPGQGIPSIAQESQVISISAWAAGGLDGEIAKRLIDGSSARPGPLAPPGYLGVLTAKGVDGTGVTVAVIDSGIDRADPSGHLTGRVVDVLRGAPSGTGGHGHHVAGIIGGSCSHPVDPSGYLWGTGVAPAVGLLNIPRFQPGYTGTDREQVRDAVTTPSTNGAPATIASCSWNAGAGNDYTMVERSWDAFVRDADDVAVGEQALTISFSAGNDGPGPRSLTRPHAGKNLIVVGNSLNMRPGAGSAEPELIHLTSSRGPTADGRIKPDVVAPGSAVAAANPPVFFNCGFPPIDGDHVYCTGTSMSQPHVAGAVALLSDWWLQTRGITPSPALARAALISAATDLPSSSFGPPRSTGPVPNFDEGWGLVNIDLMVAPPIASLYVDQTVTLEATDERHDLEFAVVDRMQPLRATLAWTDPPGAVGASPALVNDLDLRVIASRGSRYLGNAFLDGWSDPTSTDIDALNNVEKVLVDRPAFDVYRLEVFAANLVGDGDPSNPGLTDQDFALVVHNAEQPTSSGVVRLLDEVLRCGATAELLVYDADLMGSAEVSVRSDTEPAGELVVLTPVSPGSRFFRGSIEVVSGPPLSDGRLQVSDGDQVIVEYIDVDDGLGGRDVVKLATGEIDCRAPVIDNVAVVDLTDRTAAVTWSTDEPATSRVRLVSPFAMAFESTELTTTHRIELSGLLACGRFEFVVESADAAGNLTVDDRMSENYDLVTWRREPVFDADFEATDGGLLHSGPLEEWEWGAPLAGPATAHSGRRLWGTDLDGHYAKQGRVGRNGNFVLLTPAVDLPAASPARLRFWHWFSIATDGDTDDGAWVEVFDGVDWIQVTPLGGYGETVDADAPRADGHGWAGYSAGWEEVEFDLSEFAGRTVRIKLQLFEEDFFLAGGHGWYVDDLEILTLVDCEIGRLAIDAVAGCGGALGIDLWDSGLNRDPLVAESVEVEVGSVTEPQVERIELIESEANSGHFTASMPVDSGVPVVDGRLQVADADALGVTYFDQDTGGGGAGFVQAASFADCVAPRIGGISVRRIDDRSAEVAWVSDGPATSVVEFGPSPALGNVAQDDSLVTGHRVRLVGLAPCATYYFDVGSADAAGNSTRDDRGSLHHRFDAWRGVGVALADDFESDRGWSLTGEWQRAAPRGHLLGTSTSVEPNAAISGDLVLGLDLTGLGVQPGRYEPLAAGESATSPAFDVSGLSAIELSFERWLGVQSANRDLATLEVSPDNGGSWFEIWRNGTSNDINERVWTRQNFDVTARLLGSTASRVRFGLTADAAGELMGWQVDDFEVADPGLPPYLPCAAALEIESFRIDDSGGGDADGIAEPGETVLIPVRLRNVGVGVASGVNITAAVGRPDLGVLVRRDSAFGDLPPGTSGESAAPHLELWVEPCAALGSRIPLSLHVASSGGVGADGMEVIIGAAEPPLFLDSGALNLSIAEADPLGAGSTLPSPAGNLMALQVEVEIDHPDASELVVRLESPAGAVVVLHELTDPGQPFGSRNYPAWPVHDADGFAALLGPAHAGDWTLRVIDAGGVQSGRLVRWGLLVTVGRPLPSLAGEPSSPLLLVREDSDIRVSWGTAPGASRYVLSKSAGRRWGTSQVVVDTVVQAVVEPASAWLGGLHVYRVQGIDGCGR